MPWRLGRTVLAICTTLMVSTAPASGQQVVPGDARSADGVWQRASDATMSADQRRTDLDGPYFVVQLNRAALDPLLARAPHEQATNRRALPDVVLTLPLPDGRFSRFRIEESPTLAPELAAAFPEIKTYRGTGLDDPTATARFDLTPTGFHAQIIAAGGTVYVDPYSSRDRVNYISVSKASFRRADRPFEDVVVDAGRGAQRRTYNELPLTHGSTLRTYRLALAVTYEYTVAAGGTKPLALARMATTMNRVNGIYEREVAVRFTVMTGPAGGTQLIYDTSDDPYTNNNGFAMLSQNQTTIDALFTSAEYDIGHVFSTGGGGIAGLGVVCTTEDKARGVTGLFNPVGDVFDVDFVAHEIGHQFRGNHTFNSTAGNCGGNNRAPGHAYEVGSGSTIMAYAGICSNENTQLNSHDIFTFESLDEITAFVTSGAGSTCGSTTDTGNVPPVVTGPGDTFTIPASTPFSLTASATDANGDALTYLWEEHDLGAPSNGDSNVDDGTRPLFRSYTPSPSSTRTFPSLPYILDDANVPPATYACSRSTCIVGEVLPSASRNMTFHVTVRDNRAGGGGIATARTIVSVDASTGPFLVMAPNTAVSWPAGSEQTITWNVAGSHAWAANVSILLSMDGGATFPYTVRASTPNDGIETITVPMTTAADARIKIAAIGNIFFDVSDVNFSITPPIAPPGPFTKTTPSDGALGVSFAPTLEWTASASAASYDYCINTSATCDESWTTAGAATFVTLGGLTPSTTYFWQIRAVNTAGTTNADTGVWFRFTTQALTNPNADVVVDFGPGAGLWTYYDHNGTPAWQPRQSASPSVLAGGDLDGNGRADIVANFTGLGLWAFMNDETWVTVHPADVTALAVGDLNSNGRDDIVVTFAVHGLWVRYDDGTWAQLTPSVPTALAVGDTGGTPADDVVATLPSGTYVYRPGAGWSQLHSMRAVNIQIGDMDGSGIGDTILQFAGFGEWVLYDGTRWAQIHRTAASRYIALNLDGDIGNKADLVINFPGLGLWAFMNDATWVRLSPLNVTTMSGGDLDANGQTDLVAVFPGNGLWIYQNVSTWTRIHTLSAESIVIGLMNGNRASPRSTPQD